MRALRIRPRIRDARYNLALIAERMDERDLARVEYEREVESFPDNFEAWTNLGLLRSELGDGPAAVAAFETLVTLRPASHLGYYLLARAHFTGGRLDDEVLELAQRAVRLDPDFEGARELLRRIDGARGTR